MVLAFSLVFAGVGVASATTDWNDDNIFNGTINWFKKGIRIGEQGTGGVTFFNGSIVNETTTDDVDNPVTFGDNVRIDGEIWRGAAAGTTDEYPVKINDNLRVFGDLTVEGANPASGVDYDNTASGMTATNVQAGIDELNENVVAVETVLSGLLSGAGVGTLESGDTSVVISDTSVTATSLVLVTIGQPGVTAGANTNGGIRVSQIDDETGFTVATMDGNAASADIPFSYLVIY